jgi:hypothetical protein
MSVVPKDKAAAIQAIVTALSPGDLRGEKGKQVAEAVSRLAREIPSGAFSQEQMDSLISFAVRVGTENPEWLQRESASRFLDVVLNSLGSLPPDKIGDQQVGAVFDFAAKIIERDPRWLQGARAQRLAAFFPRVLEHLDVTKVDGKDLDIVFEFTVKVIAGRPDWPEQMRGIIAEWDKIMQIAIETKKPATRVIILEAVQALRKRERDAAMQVKEDQLAIQVASDSPDPAMVAALLRALGGARVEEVREAQAALADKELVRAQFLRLRTLIGVRLPEGCKDRKRDLGATSCAPAIAFVDNFRKFIVEGAPEGADFSADLPAGLKDGLDRAACALLPEAARPQGCTRLDSPNGTFSSFIGLEVTPAPEDPNGSLKVLAGCVVVSAGRIVDRVDEIRAKRFSPAEGDNALVISAEGLAKHVLNRCPLSLPHREFASRLIDAGREGPSAASALLFAGLPYERNAQVPAGLANALSAVDLATLLIGAGGLVSGVYVYNTSDSPWADHLLQAGVVSIGLNLVIKVGAAVYYKREYGRKAP